MLSRTPKTPAPQNSTAKKPLNTVDFPASSPHTDAPNTPAMNLSFRGSDLGVSLKEQNKMVEDMKKENFALKLTINELQGRLARVAPSEVERALREHDDMVIRHEALSSEIRTYKELLFEAQQEMDSLRTQSGGNNDSSYMEEVKRLRDENEAVQSALLRSQTSVKRMEMQLSAAEEEARQQSQRARQLESDLSVAHRRLLESQGRQEAMNMEIADLTEQVRVKGEAAMRARSDFTGTASELNLLTRQIVELQSALRRSEAERVELSNKLSFGPAQPGTPDGPRSSIDAIESRLMRELTAATRKVTDMEKKTYISSAERDQLLDNLRRQSDMLGACSRTINTVVTKLNEQLVSPLAIEAGNDDLSYKTSILEQLSAAIVSKIASDRDALTGAGMELSQAIDALDAGDKEREQFNSNIASLTRDLSNSKQELLDKNRLLLTLQEQNRQLTLKMKMVTDEEMPLLKAEIEQHKQHIQELSQSVDDAKRRLVESESKNFEVARKLENQTSVVFSAQSELADLKRSYQQAVKDRDDIISRLSKAESDLQAARRAQDEVGSKLSHAAKVRSAVEEQFQSELKSLHSSNTELKVQLQSAEKAKQELHKRLESVQRSMAELEANADERDRIGYGRDSEMNRLKQEADMLRIERSTLEAELIEKQTVCKRLENEVAKSKRDEALGRRNEAMEHLQAKVESLQALNAYLKEQVDTKERSVSEMEERIRSQEDQVRAAFGEIDAQNKKLKKREHLINQALKRLEAINTMKGQTPMKAPPLEDDEF